MKGRPPVDRSRLHWAVELIRNGATLCEAAREAGVARSTMERYGISARGVRAAKEAFVIQGQPVGPPSTVDKVLQLEKEIAGAFRLTVLRSRVPLMATAEAASMESDKLQLAVRAERLRNAALRLSRE